MISVCARSSQAKTAADERKKKGDLFLQNLKEVNKLTSGVMDSNVFTPFETVDCWSIH